MAMPVSNRPMRIFLSYGHDSRTFQISEALFSGHDREEGEVTSGQSGSKGFSRTSTMTVRFHCWKQMKSRFGTTRPLLGGDGE
jgi:hypothetical protein